jgi:membrane associated rhomboid family serine protease
MARPYETEAPQGTRCYRHPDRETLLSCSSCERPICTSCMQQAAVGVRCPECAGGARRGPVGGAARRLTRRSDQALATGALVALAVVVYLAQLAQGGGTLGSADNSVLFRDGSLFGPAVADGEWWRLLTSGFLHGNLLHLGFNMYLLWLLGGALERYAGPGRMLAIYLASLLWGSAGALLLAPDSPTIGASGGVFGLMAALFVLERTRGIALLGGSVGALILLNLLFTFLIPNISIGGHLGGLAGGAAAAFALAGFGRGHLAYGRLTPPTVGALAALLAGAVALAAVAVA